MGSSPVIPPPPPGFLLDSQGGPTTTYPSPPPGFVLDSPASTPRGQGSGMDWGPVLQMIQQLGGVNPNPMLDFGKGGAVGMARTGLGLGDLFAGQKPGTTADAFGIQSQNLPQQAGETAEGIMEFAAPGMAAAKAPLFARLLAEGGANALSAGVRGEDPVRAGVLGAAMPGARLVAQGAKAAGTAVGGRLVNSVIRPLEKEFRFGRNPGNQLVKEGIVGRTLQDLSDKAASKLDEVGKLIGNRLNTPAANKVLIDLQPLLAPIDDAAVQAERVGDAALAQRLRQIKDAPIFTEKPLATPAEAAQVKTLIGKATRWTGEAFDKDINQARAAVYRNINDAIDKAVPGVKLLNERYANLLSAVKSAERQISLSQRQLPVNLMDVATGGLGFMGFGDPMSALGTALVRRAGTSTPALTGAAQGAKGAGAMAPWMLELLRALSGGVRPVTQTTTPQQTQ